MFTRYREEADAEYRQQGWWHIDNSQIEGICSHSHNPPNDLSRVRLGFGRAVEAPCGCSWRITPRGDILQQTYCPNDDCEGIPKPSSKPPAKPPRIILVGDNIPALWREDEPIWCRRGDCRKQLYFNRREVSPTVIISELVCPTHGLDKRTPRIIRVDAGTQIVRYKPVNRKSQQVN